MDFEKTRTWPSHRSVSYLSVTYLWGRLLLGCWLAFWGTLTCGPQVCGQETATVEAPAKVDVIPAADAQPRAQPQIKPLENSATTANTNVDSVEKGGASDASDTPEFVRIYKSDGVPKAMQTAVSTYRKPGKSEGVEVVLIGAVHIGELSYYRQLNELFKTYDALLYEMVTEPEMGIPDPEERGLSPISTIQVGMKESLELTFQLDEVDYKAKNFVHADMTPQEFFSTMESRQEGVLQMFFRSLGSGIAMQSVGKGGDVGLIAALVSDNRAKGLRRAFAEQMQMMDGQMAALTGEDGKSTLITERNAKAFQVLDREIKSGKKKLGIFYGAGHLKDMHQRLVDDYGMELVETTWLDAWEL